MSTLEIQWSFNDLLSTYELVVHSEIVPSFIPPPQFVADQNDTPPLIMPSHTHTHPLNRNSGAVTLWTCKCPLAILETLNNVRNGVIHSNNIMYYIT